MTLLAIEVTVVYSPGPGQVLEWPLRLSPGATVEQALQASGLQTAHSDWERGSLEVGIWGRKASLRTALGQRDRVEVYRPLRVDPKTARRERFRQQGSRTAGLFKAKRVGAKPGY